MTDQVNVAAIGEALRFVQMSGIFYCPSELSEPWGLELPPMENCVWFHVVTAGECTVEVEGVCRTLRTGDLALVPRGHGHKAWGEDATETLPVLDLPHDYVSDQYAVLRHGGGGAATLLVCGGIRFDHPASRHLIESLPPLIHIEASRSTRADWMQATLQLIAEETQHIRPGSDAVVSRLCDILVIQAIRTWIERDPAAQTGWLGALNDEQIGSTIAMIHTDPTRDWSVATLAGEAAMSRSAFAARFTDMVGESAMRYVTRWRMYAAVELLSSSNSTVASVSTQVGYDSQAAFSRAFKRVIGTTPRATQSS
jgi:AraC-like DNA-binding protein